MHIGRGLKPMIKVANTLNKGGTGKTTFTKNLATAATGAGLAAYIFDMDTQQNAENWTIRRKNRHNIEMPFGQFVTEGRLLSELARVEALGCDLAFIDTPPGKSTEALAAVEASDIVLMPIWNDQDSYDGLEKTASLARRLGKPAYAILNHAEPNSRVHEDTARAVCAGIEVVMAPVVLHRYRAHQLASAEGLTAQESEPDSAAAQEIAALWNWFSALVHIGTPAPVHKKSRQKVAS